MVIKTLAELSHQNEWRCPEKIITREGKVLTFSGERLDLPIPSVSSASLKFGKIENVSLRWALKYFVIDKLQRISMIACYNTFKETFRTILKNSSLLNGLEGNSLKAGLISVFEKVIVTLREEHRLHDLYYPVKWYVYCAEHYPELGFCPDYAMELECISIPANPKGEAVRMDDPENGALHGTEVHLLISALKSDNSTQFDHLRQKAILALCLAYGRNPANFTFLREEDFFDLTPDSADRTYVLKIPRIKKRQINPRDDFRDEYVDPFYAKFIIELIAKNKSINYELRFNYKVIPTPRPLFVNLEGNATAFRCRDFENAYNSTSSDITQLLKDFVERHKIISPITGKLMHLTSRRLRYTLATALASEGISRRELARILDHSDTQHVNVYFESAGRIVPSLDKAAAQKLSSFYSFFRGDIIASDLGAVNGNRDDKHIIYVDDNAPNIGVNLGLCGESELCHLDPPYSCYLCIKFQAYDYADHEYILSRLLADRATKIKRYSRLGVQLDDVIAAVAQVCKMCKKDAAHA